MPALSVVYEDGGQVGALAVDLDLFGHGPMEPKALADPGRHGARSVRGGAEADGCQPDLVPSAAGVARPVSSRSS
jgi:hypothetical protein